jgi:pimeloyl-ACP methyl ester carboxylesterase
MEISFSAVALLWETASSITTAAPELRWCWCTARLAMVPGASHMPQVDQPEVFVGLLEEFAPPSS